MSAFASPLSLRQAIAAGCCKAGAVLADLDGCLMTGGLLCDGAAAVFEQAEGRLWIVSNNSTDTAQSLSDHLAGLGLTLDPRRIVLAGEQTLRQLAAGGAPRVALFAGPRMQALAQDLGLVVDHDTPDLAVLARDTSFDFNRLTQLVALLHRGVPLQVTNIDPAHPGPGGTPRPETGALLAAVRSMLPGHVFASLGKPAPDLGLIALARAGVAADRAVFLGDTPETDGQAAQRAGIRFVHIAAPMAAAAAQGAPC